MTPVRTCVGCGRRDARTALVRFVASGAELRPDVAGRLPGRGAYLHRAAACHEGFMSRRGPIRSLRSTVGREARAALVAVLAGLGGRA